MAERPLLKFPAQTYEPVPDRAEEVDRLHQIVATVAHITGPAPSRPTVGVLEVPSGDSRGPADEALRSLRMAVAVDELRRRLPGFDVRAYTLASEITVSELAEDSVQSLAPWGRARVAELGAEVDGLAVLGDGGPSEDESDAALAELEKAGVAIHRLTGEPIDPDPLVLAGRLGEPKMLERRREYLTVTGQAPADRPYVLTLPADPAGTGLDEKIGPGRAVIRPAERVVPVDLLGLIEGAEFVVTSSSALKALALGLGRPVVDSVAELDSTGAPGRDPAREAERLTGLVSGADRVFDQLYLRLLEDAGSRLASTALEQLASLQRRVASLEAVNAGLRRTLARERSVMASEVRRRDSGPAAPDAAWSTFNVDRMTRDLAAAQAHMTRLQGEIDAIYATRTMKALAPARRLYAIARRIIPRSP